MTEQTTQPTLDWRYLPELPPEPEDEISAADCLVATTNIWEGKVVTFVYRAWYDGDGHWISEKDGYNLYGVYAWATWPEAPPVRKSVSK